MSVHQSCLSRREFVGTTGAHALGAAIASALWHTPVRGQQPAKDAASNDIQKAPPPLNRFSRMMQEYVVGQVRAAEQRRLNIVNALRTKADAEKYVASVRAAIAQCFGPFPPKTPLNPRITGVIERDAYRIEKVLFESRPGFHVSAHLYVPQGRTFPLPGVVGSCGHSANGKAAETYQSFAQGLARLGYVVLIFDPIGQGERVQYPNEEMTSTVGVGVGEHLLAGNQQYLVGEFFGSWRAWDTIRALDFLLTRDEVDARNVGMTGNSGGGTMTTWLCGVDQRWTMAAPACFVTTFRRNVENELPADIEQCPPRVLALGLDHEDFVAALAPKPVIILAKERDYFDVRGTEEAFGRLKTLYRLLGAEANIALHVGPTYHGYSQENREAMYRWFNGVTKVSDAQNEPDLTIEPDEQLSCAPGGQVSSLGSHSIQSFTRQRSHALRKQRTLLPAETLKERVAEFLKLRDRDSPPDYRILRPLPSRGYPKPSALTYAVETDPGVHAIVTRLYDEPHLSRPPRDQPRAVLYVSHRSADVELGDEPLVRDLIAAEPNAGFYACDVRGIGDSQPDTCGVNTFLSPYGSDYFYAAHSIMLDRPYPAQRTHDVLCVLDWLVANDHREVHLVAKGWGAIPATFAALLSDAVVQVTLKNALTSYTVVAEAEHYDWPLSSFLPGVLKHFDLPDCYRALAAKNLKQVEPWEPTYRRNLA
ncbi:MAG: prolyl oligopeptidase family serine peptidase [Luteitalea sp.]|nr:prolyl oligopeptidase family serine peptidase [Luteitalea sp.]